MFRYSLILITALLFTLACVPSRAKDKPINTAADAAIPSAPEADVMAWTLFGDETVPAAAANQLVTFAFVNKPITEIIRHVNTVTGLDMAVTPSLLQRIQGENYSFSMNASNLAMPVFLDWCARLMNCVYIESNAPDIWFTVETDYLNDLKTKWQSYPLLPQEKDGQTSFTTGLIEELQKGLSWMRGDIQVVPDYRLRRVLVNTTSQGHARIQKLITSMTDKQFMPFEKADSREIRIAAGLLHKKVKCPHNEESMRALTALINNSSGLNIGFNSRLPGTDIRIPLPLGQYRVDELLKRIQASTPFKRFHIDAENALWLIHENDPYIYRNYQVTWETVGVYMLDISSVSKRIKGDDIAAAIRKSVAPSSWQMPCMLVRYYLPLDILIIINREDAVRETIRFLSSIKTFGVLQTNERH